ncbi:hypothetical protein AAFF_G00372060, partial [Aldrovandia affinis]
MDELILLILWDLKKADFETFKWHLNKEQLEGCEPIPQGRLEDQSRPGIVTLMKDYYGDQRVNITQEILKKISRNDLIERLENGQSRSKAASPLSSSHQGPDTGNEKLQSIEKKLKPSLVYEYKDTTEGFEDSGERTLLNSIYTEVNIIEGDSKGVNDEHEVWQIETASRKQRKQDTHIKCNDIFKLLPGQGITIRTVLTKGIAGIGKTISVQKFVLDWATGEANQDVDLMFVLPFRKLNLIKDQQYSLLGLLRVFHPQTKGIENIELDDCKLVFIFDGLDESRLTLNFQCKILSDVKKTSSVDVLLTNLIQ